MTTQTYIVIIDNERDVDVEEIEGAIFRDVPDTDSIDVQKVPGVDAIRLIEFKTGTD